MQPRTFWCGGITSLLLLLLLWGECDVDAFTTTTTSEPTVVPKTDGSGEYVLLIATKVVAVPKDNTETQSTVAERQSQVVVLDGDSLRDGPVWQCDLPHHVHYGLHSLFVEWESMIEDA